MKLKSVHVYGPSGYINVHPDDHSRVIDIIDKIAAGKMSEEFLSIIKVKMLEGSQVKYAYINLSLMPYMIIEE